MRVITWNMRRATETSTVWRILTDLKPDIALLQEVVSISKDMEELFDIKFQRATDKTGKPQKFGTAILVKGKIVNELPLHSEYDWVNRELEFFKGNFISCIAQPQNQEPVKVVSVYNPAWPVDKVRLKGIDISPVKLHLNPDVWGSEIIWSALKNLVSDNESWIVGGDYNISETFDITWQDKNKIRYGIRAHGTVEMLARMYNLGFTECLRKYNGKITPTFRNTNGGKIIHQIDHMFVTNDLYSRIQTCTVGDQSIIFDKSLSDHLPIIADFKNVRPLSSTKDIEIFIDRNKWVFAKTMSEIPHYYIVRDYLSEDDKKLFDELEIFIKKNGYVTKFYSKDYAYFNIGNYKYWVIGNILNRAELEPKE